MKEKDIELMEQYIYQVTRRLSKKQAVEVKLELEELISDMCEKEEDIKSVLEKLGNPAEFARNYQGGRKYLIGPEYYDNYIWILKVVLVCNIVGILISSIFQGFTSIEGAGNDISVAVDAITEIFANSISNIIVSCITAFGALTLVFTFMEYQKIKISDKKNGEKWTPNALTPVPAKKAMIGRSDSIVNVVVIAILCVLLIAAPKLFSVCIVVDKNNIFVPIFNMEKWNIVLPVLVGSLIVGLLDEIVRLVKGVYGKVVMISGIVCGGIQIICSIIIFKVLPIWNPNLVEEVNANLESEKGNDFVRKVAEVWNPDRASNVILVILIIITLLEMGATICKSVKYGKEK